jgi:hypothetical protein
MQQKLLQIPSNFSLKKTEKIVKGKTKPSPRVAKNKKILTERKKDD